MQRCTSFVVEPAENTIREEGHIPPVTEEMLSFIAKAPTAFHAVAAVKKQCLSEGFVELSEGQHWHIHPGGSYFVTRNGSSLVAFRLGEEAGRDPSFNIIASHTDSPTFKLKERATLGRDAYTVLNTEGYGGMICSTWMDRPLSVAGRVLVQDGGRILSRLFSVDRDLVLIPSLAIHMNRTVNDGYKFNKQVDMLPVLGAEGDNTDLRFLIARELDVDASAILGSDLFLYTRQKAAVWGLNREYISSPRLDDQECLFLSMKALLETQPAEEAVTVCAIFDNEEVGSGTKQGACSSFLDSVLRRVCTGLGLSEEDYYRALASSFLLSADNAHAVHPNHPELTDQTNHTYMNRGVVLKSHAGQKYTSDGMSLALVRSIAQSVKCPLQFFANRSDMAGGSTLGNLLQAQVSVNAVDIGLAQLAMHSSYETAGAKDPRYMLDLMAEFYARHFVSVEDGVVSIR